MKQDKFMIVDSVIFDLDGTLWDSTEGVLKAWHKVLGRRKDIEVSITREELKSCMGMQVDEIGEKLFPYLDERKRNELLELCSREECKILRAEGAVLYPDLGEVLQALGRKYPLFIVSNCQHGYIEAFLEAHRLGEFFKDIECAGSTGLLKGENIKRVMERNALRHSIYVGDTQGDSDAAKLAGIPFVYAEYGFGEVNECDAAIKQIKELTELV